MRELDIPATIARLTAFIQNAVANAGFSQVVVAASGGIDSSTAAALAAMALGSNNIFVLMLPYQDFHRRSRGTHTEFWYANYKSLRRTFRRLTSPRSLRLPCKQSNFSIARS